MGTTVVGMVGWIVTSRNAHVLALQRDREARAHTASSAKETRKREFRASMSSIRDSFDERTVRDVTVIRTYQASRQRVRDECANILDVISAEHVAGFESARDEYLAMKNSDIENRDWSKKVPLATPPARLEIGRQKLRKLLEQLIEHAR